MRPASYDTAGFDNRKRTSGRFDTLVTTKGSGQKPEPFVLHHSAIALLDHRSSIAAGYIEYRSVIARNERRVFGYIEYRSVIRR